MTNQRKRDDIIHVLKNCYHNIFEKNLPIYGVAYPHLKDFTTSKQDALKKISKKPPKGNLLKSEDLFRDKWYKNSKSDSKISDTNKSSESRGPSISEISSSEDSKQAEYDSVSANIEEGKSHRKSKKTIYSKDRNKQVNLDDFEKLKVIGKGTFGKVYMVKKITDGKIYAMKSIRKDVMIENDQIESAKMEKQILLNNQYPFLVKMSYVFQSKDKVYFVMNFIRGGELFTHLNNEKRFPEDKARFYAIQIMLSIGYLHKQDIVYRDIKPENILIGEDGYLYLADFGLAKSVKKGELATTFCGTPEYLAPEIIKEEGHNHAVDWWACGILIYEMIVGFPPFYHKNQNTMYDLIEKFPVKFPDPVKHGIPMSDEARDLISTLLEKDPKKRLGYDGGIEEIIAHPWFREIDVDMLLNKQLDAPFIPKLSEELTDVSNFDKEFTSTDLTQSIVPRGGMEAVEKLNSMFNDFDS
jgi:serum/glucocorticoid-regulated kinase 2